MENGQRSARRNNGNGNAAAETEEGQQQNAQPELLPRYEHAPAHIPGTCLVVRKEIVFGLGGVIVGAWGMYLLIQALKDKR